MIGFYNFLQKEFSEHVRRAHRGLLLCFALRFLLLHLFFCTGIAFDFFAYLSLGMRQAKDKISAGRKTLAENFGAYKNFGAFMKILALHKNFGAS
jgi:hypothetical protein